MGVYAIGVDLAETGRMREMIKRYGDRFLRRVFTAQEIEYCRRKQVGSAESFAARFAAKEAVFKAAGTGLTVGMRWHDVEVLNDAHGRPEVQLHGKTAAMLAGRMVHISLSHTGDTAIAMVVIS